MTLPLQITFQDIAHSDAVEARVRQEAAKLTQLSDRVQSIRAVVSRPQHRHHKGDVFHIRVQISLPGAHDIVVNREPAQSGAHEDVYVAVRDAFAAARRQLQDLADRRSDKHAARRE